MTAKELREKYLKFFEGKGHKVIPSAPLVPSKEQQLEGKEEVLFTSAGMQPLIPFLTGKEKPESKRLADCQKCLRTDDIGEVGDLVHHTFFEMLGNWSIGDYWKEDTIKWSFEFLTEELEIPVKKLAVSVFAGDNDTHRDEESAKIWEGLGIPKERIFYLGKEHNWWPSAKREQDSGEFKEPFGPCGPDTEMFVWTGDGEPQGSVDKDGRWVEIWNDVFMEFNRKEDGTLEKLPMQCVDTGMGLERALAVLNGKKSAYETDLFSNAIKTLEVIRKSGESYSKTPTPYRVITDHLRAAMFMVSDGVRPSNKERGYVLRRIIRRAMVYSRRLGMEGDEWLSNCLPELISPYLSSYPNLKEHSPEINETITQEVDKFRKTIEEGIKALKKIFARAIGGIDPENLPPGMKLENNVIRVDGNEVFKIYETYGLTPEISQEIMTNWGLAFDKHTMEECYQAMRIHQEISRGKEEKKFAGGLADHSDITIRGHTATHLLHQALRDVLGEHVHQTGSNITPERIRFDFSHPEKLTEEQIKKVEEIVNQKIQDDLQVKKELMSQEEADEKGAIGLFKEKYADKVSIYEIGNYSTEYCGGPHVDHTSQVGKFNIVKEESLAAGQRRIRATLS